MLPLRFLFLTGLIIWDPVLALTVTIQSESSREDGHGGKVP